MRAINQTEYATLLKTSATERDANRHIAIGNKMLADITDDKIARAAYLRSSESANELSLLCGKVHHELLALKLGTD